MRSGGVFRALAIQASRSSTIPSATQLFHKESGRRINRKQASRLRRTHRGYSTLSRNSRHPAFREDR